MESRGMHLSQLPAFLLGFAKSVYTYTPCAVVSQTLSIMLFTSYVGNMNAIQMHFSECFCP